MSRFATSFVLAYHGCRLKTARAVVNGLTSLRASAKPYDWLGSGVYFWESDPKRALEWATERYAGEDATIPAVIGAVIDLRNCLDLVAREDLELLRFAYSSLVDIYAKDGNDLPRNEPAQSGADRDRRLRKLDCAVIQHLHDLVAGEPDKGLKPFDTVRGMFMEGEPVYPGSAFHHLSHVQIAVRTMDCIKGVFLVPEPDDGPTVAELS